MSFDDKQLTVFQDLMSCVVAPKTLTSVHYHVFNLRSVYPTFISYRKTGDLNFVFKHKLFLIDNIENDTRLRIDEFK